MVHLNACKSEHPFQVLDIDIFINLFLKRRKSPLQLIVLHQPGNDATESAGSFEILFYFFGSCPLFLNIIIYLLAKCHLIQQLRLQVLLNDELTAVSVAVRKEGFPPCKTAEPYSLCALKFAANHKPQCKHRTLGHKHKNAGDRFSCVFVL